MAGADDDSEIACLLAHQPDEFLAWWANPEREVVDRMLGKDLMAAIESLPEAFRVVVLLINVEGLSCDEAGEVLGVSPGTIHSRMNRAGPCCRNPCGNTRRIPALSPLTTRWNHAF